MNIIPYFCYHGYMLEDDALGRVHKIIEMSAAGELREWHFSAFNTTGNDTIDLAFKILEWSGNDENGSEND